MCGSDELESGDAGVRRAGAGFAQRRARGFGVALDGSWGKSGRPSWSWCFSLWALGVFCAEELACRGRDGKGWRSGVPGWEGWRFKQQAPVLGEGSGRNWERLASEAQRKPGSWNHTNLGLSPNPVVTLNSTRRPLAWSCLSPASSARCFPISALRGVHPERPPLYSRRPVAGCAQPSAHRTAGTQYPPRSQSRGK